MCVIKLGAFLAPRGPLGNFKHLTRSERERNPVRAQVPCDLFVHSRKQVRIFNSSYLASSGVVIFHVLQVLVATGHRMHPSKPTLELEWTRSPVRMIEILYLLK